MFLGRSWILSKLHAWVKGAVQPVVDIVAALSLGQGAAAAARLETAVLQFAHWYARRELRVWTLGAAISVLAVATGLAGSVLVMRQNALLSQQNDLIVEQNKKLERELSREILAQSVRFRELLTLPQQSGVADVNTAERRPPPNRSVIQQIEAIGLLEPSFVIPALRPLLVDRDANVSSGALLALARLLPRIGAPPPNTDVIRIVQENAWDSYSNARIVSATLAFADLRGTKLLSEANLRGTSLYRAHLVNAALYNCILREAELAEADLRGANLMGAYLGAADLRGARLARANLESANSLSIVRGRADGVPQYQPNPTEGLSKPWAVNLMAASMTGCNLKRAILVESCLFGADMTKADLSGARLERADLRMADLTDAILTGANLQDADLRGAVVIRNGVRSPVTQANLAAQGAKVDGAKFGEESPWSARRVCDEFSLVAETYPHLQLVKHGAVDANTDLSFLGDVMYLLMDLEYDPPPWDEKQDAKTAPNNR